MASVSFGAPTSRPPSPSGPWHTAQFTSNSAAPRAEDTLGFSWRLMTRTWLTASAMWVGSRMPSRPKAGIRPVRVAL